MQVNIHHSLDHPQSTALDVWEGLGSVYSTLWGMLNQLASFCSACLSPRPRSKLRLVPKPTQTWGSCAGPYPISHLRGPRQMEKEKSGETPAFARRSQDCFVIPFPCASFDISPDVLQMHPGKTEHDWNDWPLLHMLLQAAHCPGVFVFGAGIGIRRSGTCCLDGNQAAPRRAKAPRKHLKE